MNDQRLAEIEARAIYIDQRAKLGLVWHRQIVPELIAEIRRLRGVLEERSDRDPGAGEMLD